VFVNGMSGWGCGLAVIREMWASAEVVGAFLAYTLILMTPMIDK
jgi:hypothetical protein